MWKKENKTPPQPMRLLLGRNTPGKMEIRIKFLDHLMNIKRKYETPIEIHFTIFITGLIIGILLGSR